MTGSILFTLLCLAPPPADASADDAVTAQPTEGSAAGAAEPPSETRAIETPATEAPDWSASSPPREGAAPPPEGRDDRKAAEPPAAGDQEQAWRPMEVQMEADAEVETRTPAAVVKQQTQARPDRPIRYRLDLQLDGGTHVVPHGSFDAFATESNLAGLGVGMRVDFRLAEGRLFLGGGLAYRRYGSSRRAFDGLLDNELRVQEPLLFVRLSFMALEGLDVYVEPGGGPSIVDVEIASSRAARQRSVTGMFNALAGVALYLPKAWLPNKGASRFTAGVDLGLGYGWRGSIEVQPSPSTDDEPLSTSSVRFGDLALRGFIWRAGLFLRFM
jgi:hypothetical protein